MTREPLPPTDVEVGGGAALEDVAAIVAVATADEGLKKEVKVWSAFDGNVEGVGTFFSASTEEESVTVTCVEGADDEYAGLKPGCWVGRTGLKADWLDPPMVKPADALGAEVAR